MSDIQRQIEVAEKEIGVQSNVSFTDKGIIIDGKLYELPQPVFKLIVDAVTSNHHLMDTNQQLRNHIAGEIMRGIT